MEHIYLGIPAQYKNPETRLSYERLVTKKFPNSTIEPLELDNSANKFYDEIARRVTTGVFLPFEDKTLSLELYLRAEFLYNQKTKIYEISNNDITELILTPERKLTSDQTMQKSQEYKLKQEEHDDLVRLLATLG
jgi:hypothetical protein